MDYEEYKRKTLEPIVNYIESVMASYSKEELEARIKKALPEKESEDERIRKNCIHFLELQKKHHADTSEIDECIAYLEKQKENPKNDSSISTDCASSAKCEDRWHKVGDFLPDDAREVLCKDAIGNFFIGRYYKCSNSWEVSMYDDVEKTNEDNPPVVMWTDIPSEKQKEPQYTKRNALFDRCVENCDPAVMKKVSDKVDEMLQKEQQPAEWSEEDEKILQSVINRYEWNTKTDFAAFISKEQLENFKKELQWLKSLRPKPHWKPSEHQLEVLKLVAEKDGTCLMGLYNELKTL